MLEMNRRSLLGGAASLCLLPSCTTIRRARAVPAGAWQKLPTEPYPGKQDDIAFVSSTHGWYGNGAGLIYRTRNAGDSWDRVWSKTGTFVRALAFVDENTGIMGNVGTGSFPNVTDTTPLYRTRDGGETWHPVEQIYGPIPQGICAIDVVRTTAIDRGNPLQRVIIHAAGRVGGPAHYLRSHDLGSTWESYDLGSLTAAIYDVKFLDPRVGFIAGSSNADLAQAVGLILMTEDGGDTWRIVFRSTRAFETVWKLHFPSDEFGFGSIQSYDPDPQVTQCYIAKTSDGGLSWQELPLIDEPKWRSFGIGFADEKLGWVGGTIGGLETRDGGASWKPVEMGKVVNKIRFAGAGAGRYVYAIGNEVHRLTLSTELG